MTPNAYSRAIQNYKQESVLTMSPGEIVVALFDECLKTLAYAKEHINNKNYPAKSECFIKAKKILNYMIASLDMKYPIANELLRLYEFYIWEITRINSSNNTEQIDTLIGMITDIRDGFKGASAQSAGKF
jgi:flagellar protein FliS